MGSLPQESKRRSAAPISKVALVGLNSIRHTLDSLARLAGYDGANVNVAVQANVYVIAQAAIVVFRPGGFSRLGPGPTRLRRQSRGGTQARYAEDGRWLFSLCASRLPESHALTRSGLIDEFNSGLLESSSYSRLVSGRDRNFSV